jgi:hypothetical protein
MKWKCFFGRHKWEYSWEQAEFARLFNKSDVKYFQIHVRYCPECGKKQRGSTMPSNNFSIQGNQNWIDYNVMTVDQKRDKKLSDLGI